MKTISVGGKASVTGMLVSREADGWPPPTLACRPLHSPSLSPLHVVLAPVLSFQPCLAFRCCSVPPSAAAHSICTIMWWSIGVLLLALRLNSHSWGRHGHQNLLLSCSRTPPLVLQCHCARCARWQVQQCGHSSPALGPSAGAPSVLGPCRALGIFRFHQGSRSLSFPWMKLSTRQYSCREI